MICKITNFLRIFFNRKKIRKIRKILKMKKIRKIRILDLWRYLRYVRVEIRGNGRRRFHVIFRQRMIYIERVVPAFLTFYGLL